MLYPLNILPIFNPATIWYDSGLWCQSERINIVSTCIPLNIWPTSNPLITFRRDQIPLNIINIQLTFSSLITCLVQSTCSQHHPQIIAIPSPWAYLRYYEGLGYRWDRHWENVGNTLILSPYDPHILSVLPLHNSTGVQLPFFGFPSFNKKCLEIGIRCKGNIFYGLSHLFKSRIRSL